MDDSGFDKKAAKIRELAGMPVEQFADHLAKTHSGLEEVAPNIAPHVHAAATDAVGYLNSKLPFVGNEMPQDAIRRISPAEKRRWLDIHEAINDPVSVLDKVANHTVRSHQVDALRAVYPDLHQDMVSQLHEQLGNLKFKDKRLPYARRLAIQKFIGQPIDSSMTPQAMQSIIRSNANQAAPESQAGAAGKTGQSQLSQINKVTGLYYTPDQKRLSGTKA